MKTGTHTQVPVPMTIVARLFERAFFDSDVA